MEPGPAGQSGSLGERLAFVPEGEDHAEPGRSPFYLDADLVGTRGQSDVESEAPMRLQNEELWQSAQPNRHRGVESTEKKSAPPRRW